MSAFLLYDDSVRSPEVRHEIGGEIVSDPIAFLERDGRRLVVTGPFERAMFARREDVVDEIWSYDELGVDDLVADPEVPVELIGPELVKRALARAGVLSVTVPSTFRVLVADHLRAGGIEVNVDAEAWAMRRRRKAPWELEGVERAQRAADIALLTGARMLREAEPTTGERLRFEGEILTAELVREAMLAELRAQGAEAETILIQSGDVCLTGHDEGRGPIRPDVSCVVDCFPRDLRTGAHADTTRTFVPGVPSDAVMTLYEHCRAALDIALESLRPGRRDAYDRVAEYFHAHGLPTQSHHPSGSALREGFTHSLGHGVGLQVHESPHMGRRSDELVEGDVVAIEPGLYFEGVGGVRLEDTVLVTSSGPEHFTDPLPYELQP